MKKILPICISMILFLLSNAKTATVFASEFASNETYNVYELNYSKTAPSILVGTEKILSVCTKQPKHYGKKIELDFGDNSNLFLYDRDLKFATPTQSGNNQTQDIAIETCADIFIEAIFDEDNIDIENVKLYIRIINEDSSDGLLKTVNLKLIDMYSSEFISRSPLLAYSNRVTTGFSVLNGGPREAHGKKIVAKGYFHDTLPRDPFGYSVYAEITDGIIRKVTKNSDRSYVEHLEDVQPQGNLKRSISNEQIERPENTNGFTSEFEFYFDDSQSYGSIEFGKTYAYRFCAERKGGNDITCGEPQLLEDMPTLEDYENNKEKFENIIPFDNDLKLDQYKLLVINNAISATGKIKNEFSIDYDFSKSATITFSGTITENKDRENGITGNVKILVNETEFLLKGVLLNSPESYNVSGLPAGISLKITTSLDGKSAIMMLDGVTSVNINDDLFKNFKINWSDGIFLGVSSSGIIANTIESPLFVKLEQKNTKVIITTNSGSSDGGSSGLNIIRLTNLNNSLYSSTVKALAVANPKLKEIPKYSTLKNNTFVAKVNNTTTVITKNGSSIGNGLSKKTITQSGIKKIAKKKKTETFVVRKETPVPISGLGNSYGAASVYTVFGEPQENTSIKVKSIIPILKKFWYDIRN